MDSFWDALEAMPAAADGDGQQPDDGWDGHFGRPDDRARIPVRLPPLSAPLDITASG
ncbi:hypothetical protein Vau01_125490 [Virgisporangium aurantiacum]|uniref:Uncharacterized protein n=1 Tax=Virgisporangium aurantiacum TaxID=175570 RepID=A0A8J3ZNQ1_9ACTN|nr:hypothetical protein Vau01_125490 [Virgisporangium aurantiacum]